MTDADEFVGPKEPAIAVCTTQCLESFQQCLLRASSVHPREFSAVEDQIARLSTWAAGIEIFAPGQTSMDNRLRYAPEVQRVVTGLLESLDYRIRACSDVLDALGKFAASDARSSANEQLEQCLVDIATEINRLNKTSNTIRRASKATQVLKVSDFQITDNDGNSVEPLLLDHFENHIGSQFPNISKIIQQRLARTMLLRQKRILYRRHRKANTTIQPQIAIHKASITLPAAQQGVSSTHHDPEQDNGPISVVASTIITSPPNRSVTTFSPDSFMTASSSPFVISVRETATLGNETLIFPPAPGLSAKRKYEQLKSERVADFHKALRLGEMRLVAESKLNDLLESDLQAMGEIICPYCLYALPVQEMFDEQKWQNHVKNDLDPYVCLFEDCEEADMLYKHSDEWLSHLYQHSRLWRCSSHRELGPFSTRDEYIRHMRDVHNTKLSDTQLRVLAKKNTRKAVRLFLSCPICDKDAAKIDGHLKDHIAEHLSRLALKSLPSYQDEIPGDTEAEKGSIRASLPQSSGTVGDDKDLVESGTEHIKEKHPATTSSMASLAATYHAQGQYTKAERLIKQALNLQQEALGEKHPDTINNIANLAITYHAQGRYNNAEILYKQALNLRQEVLGETHTDTIRSMADLGAIYHEQGRYDEAKKLKEQALSLQQEALGEKHPDTIRSVANLALTYHQQGQYNDAERLYKQALSLREEVLGGKHPDTLRSMVNLGAIYHKQGRYNEAKELKEKALSLQQEALGEKHPDTIRSMASLAITYHEQGRYNDADRLCQQVLGPQQEIRGEKHPAGEKHRDVTESIEDLWKESTFQNLEIQI
ncbi:uncharacterized protein TrAFT101_010992 [Trichoderma asperellum]|uniref:uncharacterized protein n=1 Tax=Trichoderma asperellum TaxID=101201 RepID=UPI003320B665|nr:hypothetical protein TrAFT101_010992 [Trichoderma asperellum]